MPVGALQPVRYTWLSMAFTNTAANAVLVTLGMKSFANGYRPLPFQWLKLERVAVSYNVTTTNVDPWRFLVYDRGVAVVNEAFTRTGTGWKTESRDIDVAVAAEDESPPGFITTKISNPAGTTLTGLNIMVEGYLVDV